MSSIINATPEAHSLGDPHHTRYRSTRFCTAHRSFPILYNGPPLPLQNCPSHGGSGSPSNTWFLGCTRAHNPNGVSIGSSVFAGISTVTDRQTDTPATRSDAAMRPKRYRITRRHLIYSLTAVQIEQ